MTNYYKERVKACKLIDQMIQAGKNRTEIQLGIVRTYGFGDNFVNKYLKKVGFEDVS